MASLGDFQIELLEESGSELAEALPEATGIVQGPVNALPRGYPAPFDVERPGIHNAAMVGWVAEPKVDYLVDGWGFRGMVIGGSGRS
jgi:hypothetical protein